MILATLVYVTKDNKTLMIYRCKREGDTHLGKYNGLGGKLEEGESPYVCAQREVFEESGLRLKNLTPKGILTFPRFDKQKRDWLAFVYLSSDFEGEMKKENPEGTLEWVENTKLLELPLWEGDRLFLPHVYSDKFFEGTFFYEEGRLVKHELFFR